MIRNQPKLTHLQPTQELPWSVAGNGLQILKIDSDELVDGFSPLKHSQPDHETYQNSAIQAFSNKFLVKIL